LVWNGTPFAGQHVLVRCLHGLGDTLQFIRFIPQLKAVAASVTVAIQPALLPLFTPDSDLGKIRDGWTDQPISHDVEIEIMELAYALRATRETLPIRVPYLNVPWIFQHAKLDSPPTGTRLRIGLIWAASSWDTTRSLPITALAELGKLDVEFFSLQQEAGISSVPLPFRSFSCSTSPLIELAKAMLTLDLIVSVDTMPAHLAGALGCPVWVLLKRDADWRWMHSGETSPWYPTMRLFRQSALSDWTGLLDELISAIRILADHHRARLIESRREAKACELIASGQ
jgi:hypothetical protein